MIKQLLTESQNHINFFFDHVDEKEIETILEACLSCPGLLLFTGVGKSGIIAEKIATTLASTGTKALYLPALNFLHGDIGILSENDLIFLLSKSGESEELLNLIPFIQRKKTKIIAVTSSKISRLAKNADLSVFLPLKKELCHFDLVPTTSAEIQLIFGDILAIALMKRKNFSLSEYAVNHPFGSIGKKMNLFVKDLMLAEENLPLCYAEDKLADVLVELTKKRCGTLIVVKKDNTLAGIFTDGDLRRALQNHGEDILSQSVGDLMTESAIAVESKALAIDALKTMQTDINKWVMVTPVLESGKVVGLLRMHDIIQAGLS